MKKAAVIIGLIALCLLIGTASADPQIIDGYYQIGTVSDLQWFAQQVNAGHVTYNAKLTEDIDFTGVTWTPIGTVQNNYAGIFDGNGHVIKNLYGRPTQNYYGLFGLVRGSTIQKVGLIDVDIDSTTAKHIGGIVGKTQDISGVPITTISECFVEGGSIRGFRYIGGIVGGDTYALISDCYVSSTDIICHADVGGIAPFGRVINIRNCYVASDVIGTQYNYNTGIQYMVAPSSSIIQGDSYIDSCVFMGDVATYKIWGTLVTSFGSGSLTCRNNYALNGGTSTSSQNGLAKTSQELHSQSFYTTSSNWGSYPWDFTNTWYWDTEENLPKLRAFLPNTPIIESVTLTSSTPAPLSDAITATISATSPGGTALSYQWFYNKNGGAAWIALSGQTSSTMTYQPIEAGTYKFKVTVTDSSGSTDSYEAGFTDVTAQIVTAPTLGTATINMEQGALNTPYEIKISFPLNDLGGASAVYTRLKYSTDGVTWGSTGATMRDTTGAYNFTQTVNDNTATTHYYRITAAAIDDVASVTATSNAVTFQTFAAPVISDITAPDKVQVGTPFTFSASATDANTITYQLSSNSGTTWTDITSPYTIQTAGTYQFRVNAVGYGGTTTSTPQNIIANILVASITDCDIININIYAGSNQYDIAPLGYADSTVTTSGITHVSGRYIYATGVTASPNPAHLGEEVTFAVTGQQGAAVVDSGTFAAPAHMFNFGDDLRSSVGKHVYDTIGTYQTSILLSNPAVPNGITVNGDVVTVIGIPEISSVSVNPASGIMPFEVTFTAAATYDPTYTWYETTSGSLVEIGTGQTLRHSFTAARDSTGIHTFICVAENEYGDATSNELSVTAGILPGTQIVIPAAGAAFTEKTTVTFKAAAAHGPTTYVWNFPDGTTAEGDTVTHTFTTRGSTTVSVTGTNQYGSDTASVIIVIETYVPGKREKATGTLTVPDTELYDDTLGYATSFNGDLENLDGLRQTFEKPFTSVLGSALFYIILFGVPAFLIWFATGSAKIPAIIGIIASGFIMLFFPDEWSANIFVLIITIIATGIIWIFVKRE